MDRSISKCKSLNMVPSSYFSSNFLGNSSQEESEFLKTPYTLKGSILGVFCHLLTFFLDRLGFKDLIEGKTDGNDHTYGEAQYKGFLLNNITYN